MGRTVTKPAHLDDIELLAICRLFRTRLPASEEHHYNAYLSHLGRKDVVAASEVAGTRIDPQLWIDANPSDYALIRQAYSWHDKVSRKGDLSAERKAWDKYVSVENHCGQMNLKIRLATADLSKCKEILGVGWFDICRIRSIIEDLLGDFEFGYNQILSRLEFGPGMSISSRGPNQTSKPFKLSDTHTCTASAVPVWRDFLSSGLFSLSGFSDWNFDPASSQLRWSERVTLVPGCRITFVDKTSVTKRTIAIEPSCNISMQLAIHRYLSTRLRRVGINIQDQSKNRSLALEGSLTGAFSTIDLSSASDSVCYELVSLLLPTSWAELLIALRSPVGTYKDQSIVLEKFSSMGNGYTFALETILFYAISKLACEKEGLQDHPVVYGDDIVVRSSAYSSTCHLLSSFGFFVNSKKSFGEGPFRESCGLDAFRGVDVRPVFLRKENLSLLERFAFHNLCFNRGFFDICEYVVSTIPKRYRLFGPPGLINGFLWTDHPPLLKRYRTWNKHNQCWAFFSFAESGLRRKCSPIWLYNAALMDGGQYSSGERGVK